MSNPVFTAGLQAMNVELIETAGAMSAANHSEQMSRILSTPTSPSGDKKIRQLEDENKRLRNSNALAERRIENISTMVRERDEIVLNRDAEIQRISTDKSAALAEKDRIIREWMLSNEAFKRLARQYGDQIGITREQGTTDLRHHIVDAAEDDPQYESTELVRKARENLAKI